MAFDYDLFVIGGGSGGVRAARISAGHGARVAIAEEYRVGGTCVIRGCVPKKLFVYASRFPDEFEDARGFGYAVETPTFDWSRFKHARDAEVARLESAYRRTLGNAGVTIFDERAVIRDGHTVELASGETATSQYILVATGAWPTPLDVPGAEHAITSNEIFELDERPESVVILGAGYIAVEFASIFAGLGASTCLLYRGEQVLRGFDDDLRHGVADAMRARGIDICTMADPAHITRMGDGFRVETKDKRHFDGRKIVAALGRLPNTSGLGLEEAGVRLASNGAVAVDARSRTNVESIYAVGDVTDRVNLTPVAIREGHAFADTVFGNKPTVVDHDLVPTAVFTTPEIGTVGLSEADARRAHKHVDIYKTSFRPMKTQFAGREEPMLMKLVVDADTDRVLGCHILGPDAGEMAQLLGISLRMGATKADFDATMAVHPTAAEELVTLRQKWVPPV